MTSASDPKYLKPNQEEKLVALGEWCISHLNIDTFKVIPISFFVASLMLYKARSSQEA
jgi:hypothetical protein